MSARPAGTAFDPAVRNHVRQPTRASMDYQWLIIDGYSLLHRDGEMTEIRNRDWMLARQRLVRKIEQSADSLAPRTTIVFDGRRGGPAEEFSSPSVEVVFSPAHQSADTVIERLVTHHPQSDTVLVVTSDRGERETVTAAGAAVMSCAQFLDHCRTRRRRPPGRGPSGLSSRPTLGDYFPQP